MKVDLTDRALWLYEAIIESVYIMAGDEDYLAARVLWSHHLERAFLWRAAQAIEKYIKAACLINGLDAKFGHRFSDGFALLSELAPELLPEILEPPLAYENREIKKFEEGTAAFVSRIEQLGHPDGRYGEIDANIITHDIVKLDLLVKYLRRVTINLEELHNGKPARFWLEKKPDQISRPFFTEPSNDDTHAIWERGNFGLFATPIEQPTRRWSWASQRIMRAYEVDADVIAAVDLLTQKTKWKREYLLEKVLIKHVEV